MDSVSQAALGAAVGIAVLGRHIPVWKAALSGAIVGTLPDLDVFIDKGDPVRDMVLHRAETHSLFYQALATPVLAGLFVLLDGARGLYLRWCAMVAFGLFTHSLLDAMTVYGTRLGLPFTDHPFGAGSLFIIDPLYTLPLLIGIGGALLARSSLRLRWNTAGLALSTLYAAWSLAAQAYVTQQVLQSPVAKDVPAAHILVTPTPFNTLLWRIVVVDGDRYHEGFHALADAIRHPDDGIRFDTFERGGKLEDATRDFASANLVRDFSKGFYSLTDDGRVVRITDLRMGQHPYFAFSFGFAEHASPLRAIEPLRYSNRIPVADGFAWLLPRMLGEPIETPR
ncbi:MAG: metal-dependent hydrolase [Gammaproteobacteria bacterium]|nr:metal-dependent hydrolase [Gammaproteobacteria bacterium]